MKIGINQFSFPTSYDVKDALTAAARLGYKSFEACFTASDAATGGGGVADALDISAYHNRLFHLHSTHRELLELKAMADDAGISIDSVGGIVSFSIYPLTATDASTADKSMDAMKKMLDGAQTLGASTALIIPGMLTEDMDYAAAYTRVQKRVAALAAFAPEVTLAIENVWNNFLYSPLELNRFVDEIQRDNVGIYFDVANARRFGYPQQWIRTMGKRVKALHLKDYRMSIDNINAFTNLLDGDVNYPEVAKALTEIGFTGTANVELIPPARYHVETTLAYARNTAEQIFREI